jgi:integrase
VGSVGQRPNRVSIGDLIRRGTSYRVRWRVDGRQFERSFRTKSTGDRFRRSLFEAVDAGARFDRTTGEPVEWGPRDCPTVATWSRQWFIGRWADRAAKTRSSDAELVISVVCATLTRPAPPDTDVRGYVREVICRRPDDDEPELDDARLVRAKVHLERFSPRLDDLSVTDASALWTALGTRLDGKVAAATTTNRRRTLATKLLDDAVRAGHLRTNPMRRIDRPRRRFSSGVDPADLPTPAAARALIADVAALGDIGARAHAYLTTILLTGCRPAEALGLVAADLHPADDPEAWGHITFRRGRTQASSAWTDDGETWDARSVLKWRAEGTTRRVTVPPELFEVIDHHLDRFGISDDGRLFTTKTGAPVAGSISNVWRAAVGGLWPEGHPFHHLRPYDLRHIHATALLGAGIAPTRVAERLGHSVEVLFRTYAGVFADADDAERQRIGSALGG